MYQIRLKNTLSKMDDLELFELKKDLGSENSDFYNLINKEIKKRQTEHKKICATCGAELKGINQFTLMFGPEGFKKRASFCGIDCLEEFLEKLRENKYKKTKIEINHIND